TRARGPPPARGGWPPKPSGVDLPPVGPPVVSRERGLLAKAVTTRDVLSGGRAILGIGAAWNEDESRGLGLPFPPTAERFERLEEALQICLQMWRGEQDPYVGRHYQLDRTLNSPQPLTRPPPPPLNLRPRPESPTPRSP